MPLIQLTFPSPINASVQPGDTAYYIDAGQDDSGFVVADNNDNITTIGPIEEIAVGATGTTLTVFIPDTTPSPTANSFILFGKNRAVNESTLVGYYGEFVFKNNTKDKAELFSTACEIAESSK